MNSILRCSNQDCDSDVFEVTLTVGADREPSEELREIDPEYFRCIDCGSEAGEGEP